MRSQQIHRNGIGRDRLNARQLSRVASLNECKDVGELIVADADVRSIIERLPGEQRQLGAGSELVGDRSHRLGDSDVCDLHVGRNAGFSRCSAHKTLLGQQKFTGRGFYSAVLRGIFHASRWVRLCIRQLAVGSFQLSPAGVSIPRIAFVVKTEAFLFSGGDSYGRKCRNVRRLRQLPATA